MKKRTKLIGILVILSISIFIYGIYTPSSSTESISEQNDIRYETSDGNTEIGIIEFTATSYNRHLLTTEEGEYEVRIHNRANTTVNIDVSLRIYPDNIKGVDSADLTLGPGESETIQLHLSMDSNDLGNDLPVTLHPTILVHEHLGPKLGAITFDTTFHRPVSQRWTVWASGTVLLLVLLSQIGIIGKSMYDKRKKKQQISDRVEILISELNSTGFVKSEINNPPLYKGEDIEEAERKVSLLEQATDTLKELDSQSTLQINNNLITLPLKNERINEVIHNWNASEMSKWVKHVSNIQLLIDTISAPPQISIDPVNNGNPHVLPYSLVKEAEDAIESGDKHKIQNVVDKVSEIEDIADDLNLLDKQIRFQGKSYTILEYSKLERNYKNANLGELRDIVNSLYDWESIQNKLEEIENRHEIIDDDTLFDRIHDSLSDRDYDKIQELISEYEARKLIPDILKLIEEVDISHTDWSEKQINQKISSAIEEDHWTEIRRLHDELSRLRTDNWSYHDLMEFSGEEFEHLIASLWEDNGYDTKVTQASADEGIDIVFKNDSNKKVIIQAKRWKKNNPVGGPTCRRVMGAAHDADKAIIVTSGRFSQPAIDYSEKVGEELELIDGDELLALLNESSLVPPNNG